MLESRGGPVARRSLARSVPAESRYMLGDSMGEMLAYYAAADVVLVGGSLLPFGGQNLIEPCAVGRPVIFGPHTFNFEAAAAEAVAHGAGLRAKDATEATALAIALLDDPVRRAEMGRHAAAFARENRGALGRLTQWLGLRVAASCDPMRD
jgi:3-deoxy-D-manno-octulosonic-acid transferase